MKVVKNILFGLLGIIAFLLLIALFLPKKYAVEREIIIDSPKDSVFTYIKYLKNQDDFSVWAKIDPAMKKKFSGNDGTVGAISAWESQDKNVGAGEQEIIKINEGERIDFELRFKVPFESTDNAFMITKNVSTNQTKVIWGFNGTMHYPMNLMLPIMNMEEMLGKDLENGLKNLKSNLETK
jgi:hypothetical protein